MVGLEIFGDPIVGSNDERWAIFENNNKVGYVTSAIYSPRLKKNIALAMVASEMSALGTKLEIDDTAMFRKSLVVQKPFYDPQKKIAMSG